MKVLVPLVLALGIATPAGAMDAIGEIRATLDGEELTWQVLRQDDGSAMVQITDIGPLTMIDLMKHRADLEERIEQAETAWMEAMRA